MSPSHFLCPFWEPPKYSFPRNYYIWHLGALVFFNTRRFQIASKTSLRFFVDLGYRLLTSSVCFCRIVNNYGTILYRVSPMLDIHHTHHTPYTTHRATHSPHTTHHTHHTHHTTRTTNTTHTTHHTQQRSGKTCKDLTRSDKIKQNLSKDRQTQQRLSQNV